MLVFTGQIPLVERLEMHSSIINYTYEFDSLCSFFLRVQKETKKTAGNDDSPFPALFHEDHLCIVVNCILSLLGGNALSNY